MDGAIAIHAACIVVDRVQSCRLYVVEIDLIGICHYDLALGPVHCSNRLFVSVVVKDLELFNRKLDGYVWPCKTCLQTDVTDFGVEIGL